LFSSLASRLGVPMKLVVCEAPREVLEERIRQRHTAGSDASEANLAVLDWQLANQQPIEPAERLHAVRVSATASNPVDAALVNLKG
jgi:predicted kinase